RGTFFDEGFADELRTDERTERWAVEYLLDAIGLHGAGQAKFERPTPTVGHEVASGEAASFLHHSQEAEIRRGFQRFSSPSPVAIQRVARGTAIALFI